jgi:hypothetical protein
MPLSRRGFLGALFAAPAIIRIPGLLMPVKAAPLLTVNQAFDQLIRAVVDLRAGRVQQWEERFFTEYLAESRYTGPLGDLPTHAARFGRIPRIPLRFDHDLVLERREHLVEELADQSQGIGLVVMDAHGEPQKLVDEIRSERGIALDTQPLHGHAATDGLRPDGLVVAGRKLFAGRVR